MSFVLEFDPLRDIRDVERFDAVRDALRHAVSSRVPPTRRERRTIRKLRAAGAA
jgi:hypothetical protein